jgi:putative endonuclease
MSSIFTELKLINRRLRRKLTAYSKPSAILARFRNRGRSRIGRWGERIARKTLYRSGAAIIRANWRIADGEADIVAVEHRRLLVVEVKTRHHSLKSRYPALDAVDAEKRLRLNKLAHTFIRNNGPLCRRLAIKTRRIDAVEVYYRRTWFGFLTVDAVLWHKGIDPLTANRAYSD